MFKRIIEGKLLPLPTPQTQPKANSSDSEPPVKVAKTALKQTVSTAPESAKQRGKDTFALKHKVFYLEDIPEPYIGEGDSLSRLPNELLVMVADKCNFQGLNHLSQSSSKMRNITFPILFHRTTGETITEVAAKGKKYTDKVCFRFASLYEGFRKGTIHLPKDMVDLYEQVKSTRDHAGAKKLETFLDYRDNLIFWKASGISHFDLDKANSYTEIEKAYSAINKSSANFSWGRFRLCGLGLTSIPSDLLAHFQIHGLELQDNYITEIPEKLGENLCLRQLNLANNKLSSLPESFGNLVNLITLYLQNNQLTSLPHSFGNLAHLQILELHGNKISSLPDSFGKLANLQKLGLNINRLSSLPDSFGNLVDLRELRLIGNELSSLPDSFGNLANLRKLQLTYNQFSSLPHSFGNLANLQTLELSDNKLSSLPDSFGNLVNLQTLELSVNKLSSLPDSFGKLLNLQYLGLNVNQLSSFPDSFGNFDNLLTLELSGNKLSSLSENFGNLVNLLTLELSGNKLSSLPDCIGNLVNLKLLHLGGNPLLSLPASLIKRIEGQNFLRHDVFEHFPHLVRASKSPQTQGRY